MKNAKKFLAGSLALLTAFGVVGCGSSSADESSSYVDKVEVDLNENSIAAIPDGADNTIEWMSYFDLNPTKSDPETRTDLALFESKGGKINYNRTTSMNKYEKLATAIVSDTAPDMFWYESNMTFPCNCIKDMFQPVDSIVDFDSDMWSDVKGIADQFTINDQHYVAPVKLGVQSVLTYDTAVIKANNLDDPYELYQDGEWDWDAWYDIMEEYCSGGTEDDARYGVNGWFAPFIYHSTGETLITYDDSTGSYVNNMDSANLQRAAEFLASIKKNNMYYSDWVGQASDCFKKNVLFYAMGTWAVSGVHGPTESDNWAIVPMPKDPNTDTKYTSLDINAYMWVAGSTKNDAMKTWMECAKIVNTMDKYKATDKEKFEVSNPYWTDEMYQVAFEDVMSSDYTHVIDPGYGISTKLSDDNAATNDSKEALVAYMYRAVMTDDENGTQYTWTQLRESYKPTFDTELATFNEAYKAYQNK